MMLADDINFITATENITATHTTFILTTYFFSIIFFFFKKTVLCVTSAWVLLIFLAINESNKILRYHPRDATISPIYLQPMTVVKVCDLYPTITILYTLYCNFIFDITYIRVKTKKPLFSFISLKSLAWTIFLSFFGLNKLILKLIKFFLISRYYKDISDYLYITYFNPEDNRKLLYFDEQWHANPDPQPVVKFLIEAGYNLLPTQLSFITSCWESTAKQLKQAQMESEVQAQLCAHIYPPLKTNHYFLPHTFNSRNNTIACITDKKLAAMKDFYGKNVAIVEFLGDKKLSTQIWENVYNVNPVNKFRPIPLYYSALGLLQNKNSPESLRLQSQNRHDWESSAQIYEKEIKTLCELKNLFTEKLKGIEMTDEDKEKLFYILANLN